MAGGASRPDEDQNQRQADNLRDKKIMLTPNPVRVEYNKKPLTPMELKCIEALSRSRQPFLQTIGVAGMIDSKVTQSDEGDYRVILRALNSLYKRGLVFCISYQYAGNIWMLKTRDLLHGADGSVRSELSTLIYDGTITEASPNG